MSVTAVFAKGRSHAVESVTSVMRYIPRERVPFHPSKFARKNLTKEDLVRLWGRGRYRSGYGNYNSGYSTEKTKSLEEKSINIIPKHELEKYMPDISLGPKALVTPISLMSARNGHRVTHDMLHSYDAHIGALEKPAVVDHDNINAQDTAYVGLNAATLDCRARIYRWLRRGPFFQEDHYFRRYVSGSQIPVPAQEISLFKRVVRLASKGHLKSACEEYRKITTVPPVEVYRALIAACIPHGNLGDAVSIFEDGDSKLFYVARDGEVLQSLMATAVAARNRPRIMWVYNVMRGRFYENKFARAEIDPVWQYRITVKGLVWLLDNDCAEESRVLYDFLVSRGMLNYDLQIRLGHQMREALAAGKPVEVTEDAINNVSLGKAARSLAANLREAFREAQEPHESALHDTTRKVEDPLAWIQQKFNDVDALAVMRLARFRGRRDLMAKDQEAYLKRCVDWFYTLSYRHSVQEGKPLTYLRKSKPSGINENVRVAWTPDQYARTRLLPSEANLTFHYAPGTRFVSQVFPVAGATLQSQFLALQPKQTEVSAAINFADFQAAVQPAKIIHQSAQLHSISTPVSVAAITDAKEGSLALDDKSAVDATMEPLL